jgi:murein DD-endopeptidase MepM/ murein hydrolase activator NlpD
MARRCVVLLVLGCALVATPALGDSGLGQQKQALDAKLARVRAQIERSRAQESHLSAQIGGLTAQIHTLEARVGDVSTRLSSLDADLALHQRRLNSLDRLYTLQTRRFHYLRHQYSLALTRLEDRLVSIYKQPDPGTLDVVLQAKSFQDVLDQLDYLSLIASQDKTIAAQVKAAKLQVAAARRKTLDVRRVVHREANVIQARVTQAAILRGELLSTQGKLAGARAGKAHALVLTKKQEASEIQEAQAIQDASAAIEAKIRAAETGGSDGGTTPAAPSSAGFIWPVSGPITSPFGMRWGVLHPGIDIGVPEGTPIHAAAAGTIIWCGWESGYGNLVVIDHHNGLATAYGHQSRVAVSCGQNVAQGDVVGYSGCTGFCTGPHLHFEVRVNGTPVDPLGYLP